MREPAPDVDVEPDAPELRGWNKLRGSLELCNDPDGPDESRITIPFAHLKAVFFVQDFAGNPDHLPRPGADDPSARGRRVTVTFADGEVLRGATLGYSQNAPGFFVSPLESGSNNTRIFVLAGALRHVQFHDGPACTAAPQPLTSVGR